MSEIPSTLRDFLYEHIETLEELEVLAMLAGQPTRAFTATDAERKIGLPASSFVPAFQRLHTSGLCEPGGQTDSKSYVLTRRDTMLRSRAFELAEIYEAERFAIIKLVADAAIGRIRGSMGKAFADAFVLGKKRGR